MMSSWKPDPSVKLVDGRPETTIFAPPDPTVTPQSLFPLDRHSNHQFPRFANRTNEDEMLIYTDGACIDNGGSDATAGCGFVFRAPEPEDPKIGSVSLRLEHHGPSGEFHRQTSNRAELRAVIAALQFRVWYGDHRTSLVIATDSEYVTKGATEWVRGWVQNGWVTSKGTAVKNRDLWELLLELVQVHYEHGMKISFWKIPRTWNTEADQAAKEGAKKDAQASFSHLSGIYR